MVENCTVSILVVLYNKKLSESKTLRTLLSHQILNAELFIANNGPHKIEIESDQFFNQLESHFIKVQVANFVENRPLSIIYNDFIESNSVAKKFVLLDDDSEVPESFIKVINSENDDFDLELPRIKSVNDGVIYYPVEHGHVVAEDKNNLDVQSTISIGSGLIISRRFIDKFSAAGMKLFDERFALYGVDFSLFRIMKKINAKSNTHFAIRTNSYINHSLSRAAGKTSEHTVNERLYDAILSARHYPSINT
ncbi:glycosyltransferase family 2 protein, partial [Serratia marcescens]